MTTPTTPKSTFLQRLVQDIKERFLNFETVRGIYLLPAGVIGLYITWSNLQFVIQIAATAGFGYLILDGLRKVFVNRVQQAVVKHGLLYDAEEEAIKIGKDIANLFDHSPEQPSAVVSDPKSGSPSSVTSGNLAVTGQVTSVGTASTDTVNSSTTTDNASRN